MKMTNNVDQLQTFTIEEFQSDFDNLMNRVENGESFIIRDGNKKVVIVPFNETIKFELDSIDDELVRIHTEHCDAC